MNLQVNEFIRRVLLHVLSDGFVLTGQREHDNSFSALFSKLTRPYVVVYSMPIRLPQVGALGL